MSSALHIRHRLPGQTLGPAIACAVILGGAAALGLALPHDAATQPVAPTSQCTITSCHSGDHPVLPGRRDFQIRPGQAGGDQVLPGRHDFQIRPPGVKFHPTTGGRALPGQP